MNVNSIGHGPKWVHDRPVRAKTDEKPVRETRDVQESTRESKSARAGADYAREVDVRRRIEASESKDVRRLAKDFKQLGKQLGRAILAEAREQGLDPEQMRELRSIVKDFRHAMKDTLRHDLGRRHHAERPADALAVTDAVATAMEGLAADLAAFVGTAPTVEPPEVVVAPETPKPEPVEIAALA